MAAFAMKRVRSFLFVPGNKAAMIEKASAAKADALILDLEDSRPSAMADTWNLRTSIRRGKYSNKNTIRGQRLVNSKSRNDSGIVTFRHIGRNQRDEIVCDALRAGLTMRRLQ